MQIYLVIPAYNEEGSIFKIVKDALKYLEKIIIIDDCSSDSTKKILKGLPVNVFNNKNRMGYAKTLEKGIKKAFLLGADYVITFDADGQHRASDLKKFVSIIEKKKPDLVIGRRSFKNRFMEEVFGIYAKLRYGFSDPLCGMKAYKKEVFEKYGYLETKYTIAAELTFRAVKSGASFIEVPLDTKKRETDSRFASNLKGNLLEFTAFINILFI